MWVAAFVACVIVFGLIGYQLGKIKCDELQGDLELSDSKVEGLRWRSADLEQKLAELQGELDGVKAVEQKRSSEVLDGRRKIAELENENKLLREKVQLLKSFKIAWDKQLQSV